MKTTARILRYQLRQAARSHALIVYGAFFFAAAELLLRFSGDVSGALLSLSNLALLVVPLASIVLGTMFVYDSREFTELLLSQPVNRKQLYGGLWLGLFIPLAGAFAAGIVLPVLMRGGELRPWFGSIAQFGIAGVFLTGIFTAIAFALAFRTEDRVRGMGSALLLWLFLAVVYDGLTLLAAHAFQAYPLERPLLMVTVLNPINLARVILMLNFDASALMAYTGSVFREFFGTRLGLVMALSALSAWLALPFIAGRRHFERKNF